MHIGFSDQIKQVSLQRPNIFPSLPNSDKLRTESSYKIFLFVFFYELLFYKVKMSQNLIKRGKILDLNKYLFEPVTEAHGHLQVDSFFQFPFITQRDMGYNISLYYLLKSQLFNKPLKRQPGLNNVTLKLKTWVRFSHSSRGTSFIGTFSLSSSTGIYTRQSLSNMELYLPWTNFQGVSR